MIEPRELIEECKKHLRDTARFKHEYKKDIRKLITVLEKQLILYGVVFNEAKVMTRDDIKDDI